MQSSDYQRIERAIRYLEASLPDQPSLAEVASHLGLSPFHFQRIFQRWAGLSPKRFLQVLTLAEAKRLLADSRSLLDASLELGLSGPSRLHDLFLALEAMTPGEYKEKAAGIQVRFSVHPTPFGAALFAATDRGLCHLAFLGEGGAKAAVAGLRERWPGARLREDPAATRSYAAQIAARVNGRKPLEPLPLLLKGTSFQVQVWQALLRVPPGAVVSYRLLAEMTGAPQAARAVGSAVAENPVAYLIPCHRVIRATGALGDYRWGSARKCAMLGLEVGVLRATL